MREPGWFVRPHGGGVPCHHWRMSDEPAGSVEIPPIAAVRDLTRAAENGTVRLDPVVADEFLREIGAIRDEVAMIRNDAWRLSLRPPRFGANPTGEAMAQKFVDRAGDFRAVLERYLRVLTDLEVAARQSVTNWTATDRAQALRFGPTSPR